MRNISFIEAVSQILQDDPRYSAEAYQFIREALDFTTRVLSKQQSGAILDVNGRELLEGARKYALQEYGPTAFTVLKTWGVHQCQDFGQIVFNLVNKGILRKTDKDSIRDFEDGYDFDTAFRKPFQPDPLKKEDGVRKVEPEC